MSFFIVALGLLTITYGCYTAIMRRKDPSKFGKIEGMKHIFGNRLGNWIHIIAYSVIPVIVGGLLVVVGLLGVLLVHTP